ncbi:hypothetical protein K8089_07760 [Aequorivita sp. F47161]|uniref:histidine kinase n=1 Tax=Aequorivita vitellina TaxID=2874475 RepID=A0A9X1QUD2_9FLAO|nr:ATP-binding protein [Aequorivita vitellina]MCG2418915.1 hypothetical protein [Aequorivita vitellina]
MKRIRKVGLTNFILLVASLLFAIFLIGFSFIKNSQSVDDIAKSWEIKSNIRKISSIISRIESYGLAYKFTNQEKYKQAVIDAQVEYDSLFKTLENATQEDVLQTERLRVIDGEMKSHFQNYSKILFTDSTNNNLQANGDNANLYLTEPLQENLEELIVTADQLLAERNQRYTLWKFIILGALGLATVIVFTSLYNLIQKIKPLIEELLSTQEKLEFTNVNLKNTLTELKQSNADKVKEIKAKELAIEEAEKLNESLIAKNQQLDHFAYVASHDLQEPLRTVSNFLEIFQEDFPERVEGEAVMYFDFINKAVERMRKLISGLLSFSRLGTSGEMELINLNKTVKKIKQDFAVVISDRDIIIENDELPKIVGHKIEIKQLFQNLISNAIKFTPPHVKPHIKITYQETENYYNFHISDNGVGIPEKDFTKIFDMFSRLHSVKNYEGQGIGLAFCKKIVELHLGNIWVSSTFGEGTTIHFTLKK